MKKIGIVADNYKLEKFRQELSKNGFNDFEVKPFAAKVSTIFVKVEDDQVKDIAAICKHVELQMRIKTNVN